MIHPFALVLLEGLTPYGKAHALQLEKVAARKQGMIPNTLLLVEHPPVITLGRNADTAFVLASDEALRGAGIEVHRIERGGQATYHGPGQIVGYPIVDLHSVGLGVAEYVRRLEEIMIRAAADLGITAFRRNGLTGVLTAAGKLGAIGVRVSQGVAFHGFAFNVAPNLAHYQLIVPCGMADVPVTSAAMLLGAAPDFTQVRTAIALRFAEVFGAVYEAVEQH